jgi:hypothetical protein
MREQGLSSCFFATVKFGIRHLRAKGRGMLYLITKGEETHGALHSAAAPDLTSG